MSLDWKPFFDAAVGGNWENATAEVKKQVHDFVAKWLAGDRETMRKAILAALKDDRLTEKEVIGILASLALSWEKNSFFGNGFVQRLLTDLQDGQITSREVSEIVAEWAVRQTSNDTLKQILRSAADGHLSRDEVQQSIIDWLKRRNQTGLAQQLEQMLEDPQPLSLRSLVLLATAYLVNTGKVTQAGSTVEKQRSNLISVFNQLSDSPLIEIIRALVARDETKALQLLFKEIKINADQALVEAVLSGELHDVLRELLVKALDRNIPELKDGEAGQLANTIIGVFKGTVPLIPAQTEQEELGMGPPEYKVFVRVRKMVYAAKLAVAGGPLVPTDAMAQPHVFAAAALQKRVKISTLTPEDSWPLLLECLHKFKNVEFGTQGGPPANTAALRNGLTLLQLHNQIFTNL